MTKSRNFRRILNGAAAAFLLAAPMMASATMIDLSGTINKVNAFDSPGFAVGDAVKGTFGVDLDAANNFAIDDLNFFKFAVGANEFNLDSSDFVNFSGSLSADGSTVDAFEFLTGFIPAANGTSFGLAFNVNNEPFLITGFSGFGEAILTADVSDVAVPEPRALGILSFAMILLGLGVFARRRHLG